MVREQRARNQIESRRVKWQGQRVSADPEHRTVRRQVRGGAVQQRDVQVNSRFVETLLQSARDEAVSGSYFENCECISSGRGGDDFNEPAAGCDAAEPLVEPAQIAERCGD